MRCVERTPHAQQWGYETDGGHRTADDAKAPAVGDEDESVVQHYKQGGAKGDQGDQNDQNQ
jgi:hypothetical protein